MFGYVMPCKMELKIKDYEKFKAYYCGICLETKKSFGDIPRIFISYDMAFLAVLLDGISEFEGSFVKRRCILHPLNKRVILINNPSVKYASYMNLLLTYYKLTDDEIDDKSIKATLSKTVLRPYMKSIFLNCEKMRTIIKENLNSLSSLEKSNTDLTLDIISHPFAEIISSLMSSYVNNEEISEKLRILGYNLGKWIYLIDALDDLSKDTKKNKFNPINICFKDKEEGIERVMFTLTSCARTCFEVVKTLPLKNNKELLENFLELGLLEKMDTVIKKRSENYE